MKLSELTQQHLDAVEAFETDDQARKYLQGLELELDDEVLEGVAGGVGLADFASAGGSLLSDSRLARILREDLAAPARMAGNLKRDKDIIPDALKSKIAPDRGLA